MPFMSLMTLTSDCDIQTHPSERPNTSSLWIWCKSVQWFPTYFTYKQKSHRQCQNRTLCSSLHIEKTKGAPLTHVHLENGRKNGGMYFGQLLLQKRETQRHWTFASCTALSYLVVDDRHGRRRGRRQCHFWSLIRWLCAVVRRLSLRRSSLHSNFYK